MRMTECTYCGEQPEMNKLHLCNEHNPATEPLEEIDTENCSGEFDCGTYCAECKGEHILGLEGEELEQYATREDEE